VGGWGEVNDFERKISKDPLKHKKFFFVRI